MAYWETKQKQAVMAAPDTHSPAVNLPLCSRESKQTAADSFVELDLFTDASKNVALARYKNSNYDAWSRSNAPSSYPIFSITNIIYIFLLHLPTVMLTNVRHAM